MASTSTVRARYTKGSLKLRKPLHLREGAEVYVTVTPAPKRPRRSAGRRKHLHPDRPLPIHQLKKLAAAISVGGDAVVESESIFDDN